MPNELSTSDQSVSAQQLPTTPAGRAGIDSLGRFNYWVCATEGGLYGGALCFVNSSTLMPPVVRSLGGAVWLVSLIPVMMLLGYRLPPIFVAHRIERLRQFKPLLLGVGLLQRLPYGVAAGVLLRADHNPQAAIAAVVLAPLCSGLFGGLGLTAWQRLMLKCIPESRRASLFGIRFGISCVIGIAAGKSVAVILARYPGMTGYAMLHFCAFILLMMSYTVFSATREPPDGQPVPREILGLLDQMRIIPGLLRGDRQFVRLLLTRFFLCGTYILSPFLAIHCQAVLHQPDSFLGQLIVVQMVGAIAGNGVAGWLGDRFSSKVPVLFGVLLLFCMTAWSMAALTGVEWQVIFFLFGFGFFASEVGNNTLGLEMGPIEKRATYLAIGSLVYIPGMVSASAISAVLWNRHQQFSWIAIVTMIWLAIAMGILLPLRERRHAPSTPESKEFPL